MPRRAAGLSAAKVRTAGAGRYGDGNGLYLLVRESGAGRLARAWVLRYRMPGGRMREMGLGSADLFPLADTRQRAAELMRKVKLGTDPLSERDAAKAEAGLGKTFSDVADAYIAAHEAGWRNQKHRQQWKNTLATYVFPVIGNLPVASVDTGAVTSILEPLWREKTETASRIRGRIESVLDYATARGWRSGDNPARWRGHLDNLLPATSKVARVVHHAALPWQEIGAFMAQLKLQDGVAPWALRFCILTAARTGEAVGATWAEIDMAQKVWTIPAERMKAGKEHRVPLSAGAMDVLAQMEQVRTDQSPVAPVFPGGKAGRPLSNMSLLMLLRRMERPDLTAHGFRSTFRDWAGEATNYPREVAEAALAHSIRDATEAAYRRGDALEKRRALMEDWAGFCARPASVGEVVPFRHPKRRANPVAG